MNKRKKNKKTIKIYLILFILTITIVVVGFSFAYFSINSIVFSELSGIDVTTGCMDISYSESEPENFEYNYPITDEFALENVHPIIVTVTNNCTQNEIVNYSLSISSFSNDQVGEEDPGYISDNKIRIAATRKINSENEKTIFETDYLSNMEKIEEGNLYSILNNYIADNSNINSYDYKNLYKLDSTTIEKNSVHVYKIYLWIDYYEGDTTHTGLNDNSTQGQKFKSLINLIVNGDTEVSEYEFNKPYKDFNGSEYIPTDIQLFSEENYLRDFELGFTIDNINPNRFRNGQVDTVVNSLKEEIPYPGFTFRIQNSKWYFQAGSGTNNKKLSFEPDEIQSFKIYRINNKIYYAINDGVPVFATDLTGITPFDTFLTFGVTVDTDNNPKPERYLKAEISNMYVKFLDNKSVYDFVDEMIDNFIGENMTVVFNKPESYYFDGTKDTGFHTNAKLLSCENYQKSFVATFIIDNVNFSSLANQSTFFNIKNENVGTWPGIVVRKSSNNIVISMRDGVSSSPFEANIPSTANKINVIKKGMEVYYQFDYGDIKYLGSLANFTDCFDIEATFGSNIMGTDYNRVITGYLSNMKIKMASGS